MFEQNIKTSMLGCEVSGRAGFSRAFRFCAGKARENIKRLADEPQYGASVEDVYYSFLEDFYEIGSWNASFFTGMACWPDGKPEDEYFHNQAQRLAPHYREKVFTHPQPLTTI